MRHQLNWNQLSLLNYKAHNYTDTSTKAYGKKILKLKGLRLKVLEFLQSQSSTNFEIAEELEMTLSSVCGRCRELQLLKLVYDSGKRRKTPNGATAIVWQAKPNK
jgi:predicted transcriptional regulator|tara:strand:+ start:460 stop:774 length:315 start_codon:yes stop_codon:yes gene_type:complete